MRRRKSSSISRSSSAAAGDRRDGHRQVRRRSRRSPSEFGGISTKRMCGYGKKKTDVLIVREDRALAVHRAQVRAAQRRSPGAGISNRSAMSGCSLCRWITALRIITAIMARCATVASPTKGSGPERRWSLGVVEVDDEPDAPVTTQTPMPTRSYLAFIRFT